MFIIRHGERRAAAVLPSSRALFRRSLASRIDIPYAPPPVPAVESCPNPTCPCAEMPPGLEIERDQNLSGSIATYAQQVLISTGRNDWKSKIEDDEDGALVRQLKGFLGPRGKYSDPYHNVMITNSSFAPTPSVPHPRESSNQPTADDQAAPSSAFLLPSFHYLPTIPTTASSVETLIKAFIKPTQLHQSHTRLTRAEQNILLRQPELQRQFLGVRQVDEILILICGHGGRDQRCGVLGPILHAEFEDKLQRQDVALLRHAPVAVEAGQYDTRVQAYTPIARVGQISHIGGHKWAGNVIVYIPPSFEHNALAGKGIWYGRVEPRHVEGIVAKTVLGGKVIKELFRGGIGRDGEMIRM